MKKEKLNLNDLKVKSFVTIVDTNKTQTIVGGDVEVGENSFGAVCLASYGAWCNLTPIRFKAGPLVDSYVNTCFVQPGDTKDQCSGICYDSINRCGQIF